MSYTVVVVLLIIPGSCRSYWYCLTAKPSLCWLLPLQNQLSSLMVNLHSPATPRLKQSLSVIAFSETFRQLLHCNTAATSIHTPLCLDSWTVSNPTIIKSITPLTKPLLVPRTFSLVKIFHALFPLNPILTYPSIYALDCWILTMDQFFLPCLLLLAVRCSFYSNSHFNCSNMSLTCWCYTYSFFFSISETYNTAVKFSRLLSMLPSHKSGSFYLTQI